jgi:acetyltransferase-like isoleucine patch superfamily enzyme/acyl carrier protein
MSKVRDRPVPETDRSPAGHPLLEESSFIRNKLFGEDKSAFARYKELVFHTFSWPKLIRYELLITFIGPIPGALGLLLRKRLYHSLFRKVGRGVIFGQSLTLRHADRITLGDGVMLDRDATLDARGAGDAGIVIGDRVIVNRGAAIQAKVGHIEIGNDCNIGSDVDVIAQGSIILKNSVSIACKATVAGGRYVVERERDEASAKQRFSGGPIQIGSNTRIGMGAIIQDGVTIGDNAIVAPGAVVFEDVPSDSVVWGNPARPVRNRSVTPAVAKAVNGAAAESSAGNSELQQEVCKYLENDLFIEFGPDGFSLSDSLLDSGVMDSLALVRLLLWTEEKFGVDLDFASLDPSEIDSVDKIVGRIAARRQ